MKKGVSSYQLLLTDLGDPNRTEATCLKAGQGDLYQWLIIGSLGQVSCLPVYPCGRSSRTRKGRKTSVKFCIWTEHLACVSQIQISANLGGGGCLQMEPNSIYLFHLWMGFIASLPGHVLPLLPTTFSQSEGFEESCLYVEITEKILLLQFLGSCNVPLSHWSIHKAEFTWETGFDLSKSR